MLFINESNGYLWVNNSQCEANDNILVGVTEYGVCDREEESDRKRKWKQENKKMEGELLHTLSVIYLTSVKRQ